MRLSKPSPAMVVALIALVFAMTGTGIAAKGLITGKQIKDGSITSRDLARNAVTARNLAKGAVTDRSIARSAVKSGAIAANAVTGGAIAPGAVTGGAIAPGAVTEGSIAPDAVTEKAIAPAAVGSRSLVRPTVCPGGIIIYGTNCPAVPVAQTWAEGTASDVPVTQLGGCYATSHVNFTDVTGNGADYYQAGEPDLLRVRQAGRYTIMADVTWPEAAGSLRTLLVGKVFGSGPNVGNSVQLKYITTPPAASGETNQSMTLTATLEAGDKLWVSAGTCGAVVKPSTVSLNYNWESA